MNILLIEDENSLAETTLKYLQKEGYHCEWAKNLEEANEKAWLYTYDCLIVDITLPDGSGLEIIKKLKDRKSRSGIIIVSAKNAVQDRISGLEIGADDYIIKPFDLSELNARVKAIIRRRNFDAQNQITFDKIVINPYDHQVTVNGHQVTLTRKEFDLLLYFVSNPNRLITKESIAEHLWGDDMDMADSYDFIYSHLKNLRKKISAKGGDEYIQTIYGIGYKFVIPQ
ncbi:MAG: response regulator transcription factor [Bacteroidota bacterium]